MTINGYRDLSSLVTLGTQDAGVLAQYRLADGATYERLVSELEVGIRGLNGELARHPLWASLASFGDLPSVEYPVGSGSYADRFTDYGRPEPEHAELSGHMLPLLPWTAALGWTWSKLKEMSISEGRADIRLAIDRMRNRYRKQMLQRLLSRGDQSGKVNGLGAAGYSPGFATAAANTDTDFVPPDFGGVSFTSAHEHYVAAAGGWSTTILDDIEAELMEHGHMPPYRLLISVSDVASVTALTGFVFPTTAVIQAGTGTAVAIPEEDPTDDGFRFIGSYENTRVYAAPGMPQYYGFAYRSYGANSPRNPLAVRVEKGYERPTARALRDPNAGAGIDPLQDLMLYMEFGVGVGDRTNGTTRYVNNANWADGVAL
jgi:hypothetical protein